MENYEEDELFFVSQACERQITHLLRYQFRAEDKYLRVGLLRDLSTDKEFQDLGLQKPKSSNISDTVWDSLLAALRIYSHSFTLTDWEIFKEEFNELS